jgi:cyanophycin synthetase
LIIGALELVPPSVVGDGESSVNQLIKEKQKMTKSETERNTNLKNLLGDQGESLSSIPEKNKKVFIKNCSCLAEGGMIVDCTEKVNDKIREICVDASMASRLSLAGIDILCDDIEKSPKKQNFTIIEVNGKPDLYIHHNPTNGKPRNVTKEIVEFIVEKFKNLELQ